MEQRQTDIMQHRVGRGHRTQRQNVLMHDAVQENVTIGADKRTHESEPPGYAGRRSKQSSEGGWKPAPPSAQDVDWTLSSKKVGRRFEVGDDLRVAKDHEAKMCWHYCLESGSRTEMKGCERHVTRQFNTKDSVIPSTSCRLQPERDSPSSGTQR